MTNNCIVVNVLESAALHHNNCMFSAHHLFVLDRCLEQLPADAALPRPLVRAATRLRRDAQETLSRHVTLQRKQLDELLSGNGGEWF